MNDNQQKRTHLEGRIAEHDNMSEHIGCACDRAIPPAYYCDYRRDLQASLNELAESSTQQAPYKGPINRPCSACSAGDTAMEHHNHERAQQAPEPRSAIENMRCPNCGESVWSHGERCQPAAQQAEAGDAADDKIDGAPHLRGSNGSCSHCGYPNHAHRQSCPDYINTESPDDENEALTRKLRGLIEKCVVATFNECADSLDALKSSQKRELQIAYHEGESKLKSSQQEEMARANQQWRELITASTENAEKTIVAAEAAHLAEQTKAQEAHQNELDQVLTRARAIRDSLYADERTKVSAEVARWDMFIAEMNGAKYETNLKDTVAQKDRELEIIRASLENYIRIASGAESELAAAEQTSLASQAKLIRKAAEHVIENWSDCVRCSCGAYLAEAGMHDVGAAAWRKHLATNLLTPAMLQAEEAALAAEKALEGHNE